MSERYFISVSFILSILCRTFCINVIPKLEVLSIGEALYDCIALPSCNGLSAEKVLAAGEWSLQPGGGDICQFVLD